MESVRHKVIEEFLKLKPDPSVPVVLTAEEFSTLNDELHPTERWVDQGYPADNLKMPFNKTSILVTWKE